MLLLTSTSDLIQIVTSGTANLDVHGSWVDNAAGAITPGRTNTAIAAAATTTVVGSPAGSTQRNVKTLSIANSHASSSNTITVKHTDGTTAVVLFSVVLAAGEELVYTDGGGWQHFSTAGALIQGYVPLGSFGTNAAQNPTGNVSTTEKMMGLGLIAGFSYTPLRTGNILILIKGMALNATLAGDGTTVRGRYGTGTAPSNAAAVTGTQFGGDQPFIASTTAGQQGFAVAAKITGLTVGTTYWFDLGIIAVTGGGSTVKGVECIGQEVP